MTTVGEIRRVFPRAEEAWLIEIVTRAPAAGIDTRTEMASFLAQAGHETAGFTRFEESLDYSVGRLMQVWPRRFPRIEDALPYAHQPERLAERVYGGRMGNRESGDGWAYRGRGPLMLTGRDNYGAAGEALGKAIGFNPQRAGIESEAKREMQMDKNLRTVRMDDIASDWADAILRNDTEKRQEAMARLRQWNRDNPTLRIDGTSIMRSVRERVKAAKLTGSERFIKSVPKAMKPEARESLRP